MFAKFQLVHSVVFKVHSELQETDHSGRRGIKRRVSYKVQLQKREGAREIYKLFPSLLKGSPSNGSYHKTHFTDQQSHCSFHFTLNSRVGTTKGLGDEQHCGTGNRKGQAGKVTGVELHTSHASKSGKTIQKSLLQKHGLHARKT